MRECTWNIWEDWEVCRLPRREKVTTLKQDYIVFMYLIRSVLMKT